QFALNPLPDKAVRDRLGLQLGLTTRQVQIWFQNKRAKTKQEQQQVPSSINTMISVGHVSPMSALYASNALRRKNVDDTMGYMNHHPSSAGTCSAVHSTTTTTNTAMVASGGASTAGTGMPTACVGSTHMRHPHPIQ